MKHTIEVDSECHSQYNDGPEHGRANSNAVILSHVLLLPPEWDWRSCAEACHRRGITRASLQPPYAPEVLPLTQVRCYAASRARFIRLTSCRTRVLFSGSCDQCFFCLLVFTCSCERTLAHLAL